MSQIPRLSRARQLKASVWPGRVVDGYGNFNAARLRKLAAARSTGMLPFSGEREGAVCLRDGDVVYAESSGTPAGPAVPRDPAAPEEAHRHVLARGSELAEGVKDPGQHLRRWRLVVGLTRRQLRCLRGLR